MELKNREEKKRREGKKISQVIIKLFSLHAKAINLMLCLSGSFKADLVTQKVFLSVSEKCRN